MRRFLQIAGLCIIVLAGAACVFFNSQPKAIENYENIHSRFQSDIGDAAHYADIHWLPNGTTLLTVASLQWSRNRIYIGNPESGAVEPFLINGDYFSAGATVASPDGHYLAYNAYFANELRIAELSQPLSVTISLPYPGTLAWAPDSNQLAIMIHPVSDTIAVQIINVSQQITKTIFTVTDPLLRSVGEMVWSPDGKTLAFSLGWASGSNDLIQYDLYTLSLDNSRVARLTNSTRINEDSPSWLPDSKSIVFISAAINESNADAQISSIDLQTDCINRYIQPIGVEHIALSQDGQYAAVVSSQGNAYILDMNVLRKNEKDSISCPK